MVKGTSASFWREGRKLLSQLPFLASCLAICQSFLFLVGVTRIAFPLLAVNRKGIGLEIVGTIVAISRLTDTLGRFSGGWLADRIKAFRVILLGVAVGMTMGFGLTNVGATIFALQSAPAAAKGLGLGLSRASTSVGQMLGPLLCGALIERLGYEQGFQTMAAISAAVLLMAWYGLKRQPAGAVSDPTG
jgi:nitrate/nitrite transporter NarK